MSSENAEIWARVGCVVFILGALAIARATDSDTLSWLALGLLAAPIVLALVFAAWVVAEARRTASVRRVAESLFEGGGPPALTDQEAGGSIATDREAIPDWMLRLYEGKTCPLCEAPIEAPSSFAECPDCRRWYHETCWRQFGGCVQEGCPSAPGKLTARRRAARPGIPAQEVAVARAIHNVGFCPYCQTPVQAGVEYVTCPACKTPYHSDCWQENNGCAVYGCNVRVRRD